MEFYEASSTLQSLLISSALHNTVTNKRAGVNAYVSLEDGFKPGYRPYSPVVPQAHNLELGSSVWEKH